MSRAKDTRSDNEIDRLVFDAWYRIQETGVHPSIKRLRIFMQMNEHRLIASRDRLIHQGLINRHKDGEPKPSEHADIERRKRIAHEAKILEAQRKGWCQKDRVPFAPPVYKTPELEFPRSEPWIV